MSKSSSWTSRSYQINILTTKNCLGATCPTFRPSELNYRGHELRYLTRSRIRCDVGKEWKTPEHFSKTKLSQLANNMRRAKKATAANSGIACLVHSGEPETMLKCQGPCGKTYGLEHFSRNTRIRGVYVRLHSRSSELRSY